MQNIHSVFQGIIAAQAMPPEKQRYIVLLKSHDWEYDRSDDFRVWRAGCDQRQVLNSLQSRIDPGYAIWNQHCHVNHRRDGVVA